MFENIPEAEDHPPPPVGQLADAMDFLVLAEGYDYPALAQGQGFFEPMPDEGVVVDPAQENQPVAWMAAQELPAPYVWLDPVYHGGEVGHDGQRSAQVIRNGQAANNDRVPFKADHVPVCDPEGQPLDFMHVYVSCIVLLTLIGDDFVPCWTRRGNRLERCAPGGRAAAGRTATVAVFKDLDGVIWFSKPFVLTTGRRLPLKLVPIQRHLPTEDDWQMVIAQHPADGRAFADAGQPAVVLQPNLLVQRFFQLAAERGVVANPAGQHFQAQLELDDDDPFADRPSPLPDLDLQLADFDFGDLLDNRPPPQY